MKIITMIIFAMLCCTNLHAVREHYEAWTEKKKLRLKTLTLEQLNNEIKSDLEYAFIYLNVFEENLYLETCDDQEECIKYYQNKIKELDFGLCPSEFCLEVEKRAYDFKWEQTYDCDVCFYCDMWEAWAYFNNYELEMEELKIRAGL